VPPIQPGDVRSSLLSHGRCYVYVLPCAYEDILKLGFSRDPLGRMLTLHRRYFEFFDLDRAFLIETETVRDSRRLELKLGNEMVAHNAPSPLVIRRPARGHTEWYRGAYPLLQQSASVLVAAGYRQHSPIKLWAKENLLARSDPLYAWSKQMYDEFQSFLPGDPATASLQRTLLDALDAYPALDIDLEPLLPLTVWQWYRDRVANGR
jgi:hypothetical protein